MEICLFTHLTNHLYVHRSVHSFVYVSFFCSLSPTILALSNNHPVSHLSYLRTDAQRVKVISGERKKDKYTVTSGVRKWRLLSKIDKSIQYRIPREKQPREKERDKGKTSCISDTSCSYKKLEKAK